MTRTELYTQFSVAVLANWTIVKRKPDTFLDRFVLGFFCGEPSTSDQLACKEELREQLQRIVALNKREARESLDKFVKSCKANKGRKISLLTADKLFDGFKQRIAMVNAEERYGVSVAVVLLFGSYMRREATVGDIDLMVLCVDKPNYELRREELSLTGLSRTIVD
jgi:predicted nucleotidyltransferase